MKLMMVPCLIIKSMSYSRLRIAFQKWLSLQALCSIIILSMALIIPIISSILLVRNFPVFYSSALKFLYKDSLGLIIRLTIFQISVSTLALLVSLYFGQKITIAFGAVFAYILFPLVFFLYRWNPDLFDWWIIDTICLFSGLILKSLLVFAFYKKDFA